jgi:phosphatidylserine/phosphatidylglycerophosphate/cardiolipin synthase-like enzyme
MADFLTTNGTSYEIENVIIEAKEILFLVSPYLQISKTFYERLKDASDRSVPIRIIYGKDELKPNERNSLADLKGVELYYFENLHAKCYFNEDKMVITSMNMYEFSEKNNREMGVLIEKIKDPKIYEKAVNETKSIIQSSEPITLNKAIRTLSRDKKHNGSNNKNDKTGRGYCIRCQKRIDFDPTKPLCGDCYSTWVIFENADFAENVCHRCGEFEKTSMRKPLCNDCFQLSNKI